jgi:hypothetical protein
MIENYLQRLVGLRLTAARLTGGMLNVHFGSLRDTPRGQVGDFALHIQCPWRIELHGAIVTGREDLDSEAGDETSWQARDGLPRGVETHLHDLLGSYDQGTRSFVNHDRSLDVTTAQLGPCGNLCIELGDYRLSVFPSGTANEDWRIFEPSRDTPHFVLVGGAIEED